MVLLFSSVSLSLASLTLSLQSQRQDNETEAAKWNSAFIDFIIYTQTLITSLRLITEKCWSPY